LPLVIAVRVGFDFFVEFLPPKFPWL